MYAYFEPSLECSLELGLFLFMSLFSDLFTSTSIDYVVTKVEEDSIKIKRCNFTSVYWKYAF
jgi:hypothetical protein